MRPGHAALLILSMLAAPLVAAGEPGVAPGLRNIEQLGEVNGQALACGAKELSERARALMLEFAPRTPEYGAAFEQATNRGYLGQIRGGAACPAPGVIALRLEEVATALRATGAAGK